MGTRALIHVKDSGRHSETLTTIYCHSDGYPEGLGRRIADFIRDKKISNGIVRDCFNSMGCLAASLISHLKEGAGGIYVYKPDSKNIFENYTYTVYTTEDNMEMSNPQPIYCDIDVDLFDLFDLIDEG
jgi:hypothetical protein